LTGPSDASAGDVARDSRIPARATGWAWILCWLMFASTMLNYMDRQAISLVRAQICQSFGINEYEDFGWVISAFIMTYALFQVPAGYLVDRWDLRFSYAAAVAWWSLAAVATAFVPSLAMLLLFRALLGVGESFNWPTALRVTARVLRPSDRGLGNGIFNSGAAVGAVVTPLVVNALTPTFGWRATFGVIGAVGFVWVAAWLFLVQGNERRLLGRTEPIKNSGETQPAQHLSLFAKAALGLVLVAAIGVGVSALRYGLSALWLGIAVAMIGPLLVTVALPSSHFPGNSLPAGLAHAVRLRRFWIMLVVAISINLCWHFLVNWVPSYLKDERGFREQSGNYLSAVTFLAADLGNLGGGWLSRALAARGLSVVRARQLVMGVAALCILAGVGLVVPQRDASALFLLGLMAAGTAAFMANFFAFTQEVSARHTGLVVGYLGGLANLFVARSQPIFGSIKDTTGSFTVSFLLVGLAPLVGLAALFAGWNRSEPDDPKREINQKV
jgi:ACS family hexuronate transporter-like MFS transporter